MDLKFGHIELFVKDVHKAKAFYQEVLGFELTVVQGDEFVWLKSGQVEVLLRPGAPPPESETYHRAADGVVLYTSDLESTLEDLRANGLSPSPMEDQPGCYTFTDLDGHWFQLVDPSDHG